MEFIRQIMSTAKNGGEVSIKEAQEGVKRYLKKIPMTHIKTQINQLECPQAEKLKEELTGLLSKYGFFKSGDYNPFDHQLADMCGVLAQRIGQFLNAGLGKPPASYKKLASAIIIHLLRPTHPYLIEEIEINEEPSIVDLAGIACVLQCPMLNNVSKLKNL